jgi:hypothetical protein
MSILWTTPLALIGLALVALPIAVHLLAREHLRQLPYPSLRFLRQTQLASFRRRTIEDAILLACRVAIVAAAAAALAGPMVQTAARTAGDANRVSRAVVTIEPVAAGAIASLEAGAFRFARWQRARIADALTDAVRWLDAQPRSAREIVIAGALRRGSIAAADVAAVPPGIGIRFEQTATDGPADLSLSILTRRNGELARVERAARLTTEATRVTDGATSPVPAGLVTIAARPADTALADAALRVALDAGVPWRDFDKRVALVWSGGSESAIGAGTEVVRMPVPVPSSSAADAVLTALTKVGRPDWVEPLTIEKPQLDAWSRPPGAPSADAPMADEGDRRWLWGLALVLLGIEWWLRRSRESRAALSEPTEETRVA